MECAGQITSWKEFQQRDGEQDGTEFERDDQ